MHARATVTTLAATAAPLTSAAAATAATEPLSKPRIAAHFSLAAEQQPENITVDRTGAAYLTLSFARQIVRIAHDGHAQVPATLPAPAKASPPTWARRSSVASPAPTTAPSTSPTRPAPPT